MQLFPKSRGWSSPKCASDLILVKSPLRDEILEGPLRRAAPAANHYEEDSATPRPQTKCINRPHDGKYIGCVSFYNTGSYVTHGAAAPEDFPANYRSLRLCALAMNALSSSRWMHRLARTCSRSLNAYLSGYDGHFSVISIPRGGKEGELPSRPVLSTF